MSGNDQSETELRVVQSETYCIITEVQLKDGKPSTYEEESLLHAPTIEDLTKLVHAAVAALGKPALSEADDFPDQDRTTFDMVFARASLRNRQSDTNS